MKDKVKDAYHASQFIEHFFYTDIVLSRSLEMPCTYTFRVTANYIRLV